MTQETATPFGEKPREALMLVRALKTVLFLIGAGLVTAICFAAKSYVRDTASSEVATQTAIFAPLPLEVQSLKEFRDRQEHAQESTNSELRVISNNQASTNVILHTQAETQERILSQLDRIERRLNNRPATP